MTDLHFDTFMSETDAMLWAVERDPVLRSTITLLAELERPPDRERLDNAIRGLVRDIPRFRQRVDSSTVAPPRWEDDPHFDLTAHVRHVALPADAGPRGFLELAQVEASRAFDKDRPLWEFTFVHGLPGGGVGFVVKIHHAIADGMGLLQMAGALMELGEDETRDPADHWSPERVTASPLRRNAEAVRHRVTMASDRIGQVARGVVSVVGRAVREPAEAARRGAEVATSAGRVMKLTTAPMSVDMVGRSARIRFDVVEVPVADLKRAGRIGGGTLNDAFVAASLDGLRRYHEARDVALPALRMAMAVNARDETTANEGGNHLSGLRVEVDVPGGAVSERVATVTEVIRRARAEAALPYVMALLNVSGQVSGDGAARLLGAMQKTTDVFMSNLPGPPVELWMSGARIGRFWAFGPRAGAAVNLTLLSYADTAYVGVNTDPSAVVDPVLLVGCLRDAFAELAAAAAAEGVVTGGT